MLKLLPEENSKGNLILLIAKDKNASPQDSID